LNALATQPLATTAANDALFDAVLRGASRPRSDGASELDGGVQNPSAVKSSPNASELRDRVGEFVGNVFYGTLFRQLQNSNLKGKYLHGGRGEEVFQSQLHMEYAKRIGRSPNDPISNRIYEALKRARPNAAANQPERSETTQ